MGGPTDQLRRDSNADRVNQSDVGIKRAIPTELGGGLEGNKWCPIESCSVQNIGILGFAALLFFFVRAAVPFMPWSCCSVAASCED
jgi:hypothetical protein